MRKIFIILILTLMSVCVFAGEWQWSVSIKCMVSSETDRNPDAFLWIPPKCEMVKAVMVGQHNMSEETLFEMDSFRQKLADMGVGMIWITPGLDQQWKVETGVQKAFETMMNDFADVSGYSELKYVPIIPIGHSAMATYPWNFAAWNPERTLAIISLHGDAPSTNLCGYGRENLEWGRTRNIDGIPGLMIEGEYEWWEARVNPALAFRMKYPDSCISFLCDTGRGHFDVSPQTADYIALFIRKALEWRYPQNQNIDSPVALKKVNMKDGWLAERWWGDKAKRPKAAPYNKYKGDRHDAFWYFDEEMAMLTEDRYRQHRNKKMQYIGFMQNGELTGYNSASHVKAALRFLPHEDGLTFNITPVFTDSLRTEPSDDNTGGRITMDRVCGPVEVINDTTFRVSFYRMGMYNPRRTADITLLASNGGDKKYKGAVQELSLKIPYRNTGGKRQYIMFPGIEDISAGTKEVILNAVSDCGLPVSYYVKQGPAVVEGNTLKITDIPIRSKYPVKVTVVAWQYGIGGKVQTAEPVERDFYIIE